MSTPTSSLNRIAEQVCAGWAGLLRFSALALASVLILGGYPAAFADYLPGVSATTNLPAFSDEDNIANVVNGVGLTPPQSLTAMHAFTTDSNGYTGTNSSGTVTFNLGGMKAIQGFSFWNNNGDSGGFGIKSVTITSSTDGSTFKPIAGAPTSFAKVTTNGSFGPQIVNFNAPITAAYIRFQINSSYDGFFVGLSEVAFNQAVSTTAPVLSVPTQANITQGSATLGGSVTSDGGAAVMERGVVFSPTGTNANPLIGGNGVVKVTASGTTGPFTVNAAPLSIGTGYSYKAYATNSVGTTYSSVDTFTTLAPSAPLVTSPTQANITTSSATLGGNVISSGGAAITERGVVYALTASNSSPQIGGASVLKVTASGTTGSFTVNASPLTPASSYSYAAYATNSVGTTYSSVDSFTTLATAPTVTSPTKASVTQNFATLGGNVTSDGGATITARGVVYALTATNGNPQLGGSGVMQMAATGTTGVFTVGVSGLTAASGYSYAAYATNSAGTSYSSVDTFAALSQGPTVTSPTATNFGGSTATLGGNVTDSGGSAITERGVVYALSSANTDPVIGGSGVSQMAAGSAATGPFTVSVPNLTRGAAYTYKAYAINSGGGTGYSGTSTFAIASGPLVVTNTGDNGGVNPAPGAGTGTLRQAIVDANANAGSNTITFNIPGAGVQSISVANALPTLSDDGTTVDGYTQPGASQNTSALADNAVIRVEILGNASTDGLVVTASNCLIRGLAFSNSYRGIHIESGANGNVVAGNFFGLRADGTTVNGSSTYDIHLDNAGTGNVIGGTSLADRNVVCGGYYGIATDGSTDTCIQGNFVGLDATGLAAAGNTQGVTAANSSVNTLVGGTGAGAGNIVSGNALGIWILNLATGTKVQGNLVGTTPDGTAALGNTNGIIVQNAVGGLIGGDDAADGTVDGVVHARNVISGSQQRSVVIDSNSSEITVQGNYIGTDPTGLTAIGNQSFGAVIISGSNNLIGGVTAGARNLLCNGANGVEITGSSGKGNTVQGNSIGVGSDGLTVIANTNGVAIDIGATNNLIGGDDAADGTVDGVVNARNIISGNTNRGVYLIGDVSGNTVQGNYIGTDVTGTVGLGVQNNGGVDIESAASNTIGGATAGAGNLISSNINTGIAIGGDGTTAQNNVVEGNYIGTNAAGTAALGNGYAGIDLFQSVSNTIGGTTAAARNVIAGSQYGVLIESGSRSQTVEGNYIGTTADGTQPLANSVGVYLNQCTGITIGGTAAGAGNVISGSIHSGISITGDGTTVNNHFIQGNYIGLAADGVTAMGNEYGINLYQAVSTTIGGAAATAGNFIAGNSNNGILVSGDGTVTLNTVVQGNTIGLNIDGAARPNQFGIALSNAPGNTIGGTAPGAGNIIASNNYDGVWIYQNSPGNSVRQNSIYGNTRLGINLVGGTEDGFGVTANDPNDADIGPNFLQNYPVITSVMTNGTGTIVSGKLNSSVNTLFAIDFYDNPTQDPSGHGQGKTYLSTTSVQTNGNDATFSVTIPGFVLPAGHVITSTATDPNGNTSEFSATTSHLAVDQNGVDLASGGTKSLGGLAVGQQGDFTLNIANAGQGTLNLTGTPSVTLSGANPGEITVMEPGAVTLASGGSTGFTLHFAPLTPGTRTLTITIPSDDPDANPYTATLKLTAFPVGGAPIGVGLGGLADATGFTIGSIGTDPGTNNYDASEGPLNAVDYDATSKFRLYETANAALAFEILNPSVAYNQLSFTTASDAPERDPASYAIYGSMIPLSQANPGSRYNLSDFTLIAQGSLALPAARGASTVVAFSNSTVYRSYLIVFPTVKNSASADSTQIAEADLRSVSSPAPMIAVSGNGTPIVSGDSTPSTVDGTNFGTTAPTVGVMHSFTIHDSGAGALNLVGNPVIGISGPDAASFTVTAPPATPVAANGGSSPFTITFAPTTAGAKNASVIIASNDPAQGTYTFAVSGLGQGVPTVTDPTHGNLSEQSATLGGEVTDDGGASITERGVVYAPTLTNSDPQIGGAGVVKMAAGGTKGIFTVGVAGLSSGTAYTFKAYATNASGTGYTSASAFSTANTPIVVDTGSSVTDPGDGHMSLAEAIAQANSQPGLNIIQFASALAGQTITLSQATDFTVGPSAFIVDGPLIIQGPSAASPGTGITLTRDATVPSLRFFYVTPNGDLTLRDMTVENGVARGGDGGAGGGGGAAGLGGAIYNRGALTLKGVILSSNLAEGGDGGAAAVSFGSGGGGGGLGGVGATGGAPTVAGANSAGGGGGGAGGNAASGENGNDASGGTFGGGGGGGAQTGGGGGAGGDSSNPSAQGADAAGDGGGGGGGGAGLTGSTGGGAGFGGGGGGGGFGATGLAAGNGGAGGFGGGGGGGGALADLGNGPGGTEGTGSAGGFGGGTGANASGTTGGIGGGGGGFGGAVFNDAGTLVAINSTVIGNSAVGGIGANPGWGLGGGLYNHLGTLTLTGCTLSGNLTGSTDTAAGGAVCNEGVAGLASATLTNCTLSGNGAVTGGGVYNYGLSGEATLKVQNCTIAGHSGTGISAPAGPGDQLVTLGGTLLAANTGGNLNVQGTFFSQGYNLSSDDQTALLTDPTDLNSTDPQLDPNGLQSHGGLTQTIALQPTSPAIDKGKLFGLVTTDQRGLARPVDLADASYPNAAGGDGSDIGAYEVQPPQIAIAQDTTAVVTGGTVDFGSASLTTSSEVTLTLENLGDLDLTGASGAAFGLTFGGTNPGDFTVTQNPASPVAGMSSTTFTVQFAPQAGVATSRTATLQIASNDGTHNPFTINLTGTLDVTPPDTTITDFDPGPLSTSTNATITFTGTDNVTAAADLTFEGSLDGAPFAAVTSPVALSGLALGSHTYEVRAIDAAGNVDPTPAMESWTIVPSFGPNVVAAAGDVVQGEPAGTLYSTLGIPSLNASAATAAIAKLKFGHVFTSAIVAGNPLKVLVRAADAAPGTTGKFSSFTDVLLNDAGKVTFLAKVTGGGAASDSGIWTNRTGTLALLARENSAAPGVASGRFSTFTSVAFNEGVVAFTATLRGVPAKDSDGLWIDSGAGPILALQKGQMLNAKTVARFIALDALNGSGQGNGVVLPQSAATAQVVARVIYTDGSSAEVACHGDGTVEVIAAKGDNLPGPGTTEFLSSVQQTQSTDGRAAFTARLGTTTALFVETPSGSPGVSLARVATTGDVAPGAGTARFTAIQNPVNNDQGSVAWKGTLRGTSAATAHGIWWSRNGTPALLVREGGPAPGTSSFFAAFQSLALSAGSTGAPLFTATIRGGGATAANNTGLWAVDDAGNVQLLLRTGTKIDVGGTMRTVHALTVLSLVPTSPAQTRSYAGGQVVVRVTFTGTGGQALVTIPIPIGN